MPPSLVAPAPSERSASVIPAGPLRSGLATRTGIRVLCVSGLTAHGKGTVFMQKVDGVSKKVCFFETTKGG